MKVWRATRSLHYINDKGESVVVFDGQIVDNAPESLIDELLADGFIREGRSTLRKEE